MRRFNSFLIAALVSIGTSVANEYCPYPGDQIIKGATVTSIETGTNGVNQKLAYFQISNCSEYFAFPINDETYGKVWYSTILTAISSGAKIDFWANPSLNTYIPGFSSPKGRGIDRLKINAN